jgi:hypothetical protein
MEMKMGMKKSSRATIGLSRGLPVRFVNLRRAHPVRTNPANGSICHRRHPSSVRLLVAAKTLSLPACHNDQRTRKRRSPGLNNRPWGQSVHPGWPSGVGPPTRVDARVTLCWEHNTFLKGSFSFPMPPVGARGCGWLWARGRPEGAPILVGEEGFATEAGAAPERNGPARPRGFNPVSFDFRLADSFVVGLNA